MFKRIAKLFGHGTEPKPDQVCSAPLALNQIASGAEDESTSERREASAHFMRLLTAHLAEDERRRLVDMMLASFDTYGNSSEALEEIALGKAGQKTGQWLVIQCDWKAPEELEWQVAEVSASFGIAERWSWGLCDERARTVPGGLSEAANWAAPLGFEMLHIDLGSDTYFAVLIKKAEVERAYQTALSAGLKVLRTPEFKQSHA
ncbi:hypothetical protein EJP69_19810 [Variovorax gossypii]|uniref:DUF6630 domain-containing protein n=1 Tax=Variovorax gossypii TaxID=1679495 RepID=A0A431TJK1_9BURK|nr:hypothetical protein [Variovorax gossypii]RTQ32945.1 hypothetical protein EJP69_19810 [Variovorax gossypii]